MPLKRTAKVKERRWLKSGLLFIMQKSDPTRSIVTGVNQRDENLFIVRIRARFANAVYQSMLIIARFVVSIRAKPWRSSLKWRRKQVRLWKNFDIRQDAQSHLYPQGMLALSRRENPDGDISELTGEAWKVHDPGHHWHFRMSFENQRNASAGNAK